MKKRLTVCVLALTLIFTMLVGCGTQSKDTTGTTSGTKDTAKVKDSIIVALPADMANLDPLHTTSATDSLIYTNIYDTLVNSDKSGNAVPVLAESWTASSDGMSYTFKLRKGVKFHNEEEFKASDVAFTVNSAKKSPYMESVVAPIKDVVAVDDYTVKINLNHPYAPFLSNLYDFYMLNEKAVKEGGENYGSNPIGTGAYKFVKREVGQKIELTRNDEYFNGPAPIKNLTFKVITDPNTALISLEAKEIDFVFQIPMISLQELKSNPDIATHEFESVVLSTVIFNHSIKPFNNPQVRQAVNYAIDKDAVIQIAEEGMGKKAQSIFNELTCGYSANVKGYEYNVEKAKALLAQAGYPNGFSVKFKTMDGALKKAAEVIQENLAKIGITVNIEMCEKNAYNEDLGTGNFEMGNLALNVGQDADAWEVVFKSTGGFNILKYKNTKVDELFDQGKKIVDKDKRVKVYEQLAQLINDDAAVVPLYYSTKIYAGSSNLKIGFIDAGGDIKVSEMSYEK